MRHVFADAHYWIAATNPADSDHQVVRDTVRALGDVVLHTSDEVLAEFLSYASGRGSRFRAKAVAVTLAALESPSHTVWPQSRTGFLAALELYEARQDKGYSLVDCAAMALMQQEGIKEVLTRDRHFEQEGFAVLIRD